MPSHIFMSLGMWDDVIKANQAAWASSEARIKKKGLTAEARDYHTLHWLEYAYLQQGRVKESQAILKLIDEDSQLTPTPSVRGYAAAMHATFTIEARQWNVDRFGEGRSGLRFSSAASELFAIGMSGAKTKQIEISQQALEELKILIDRTETSTRSNQALAGLVMVKELEGLLLLEAGQTQKALGVLQEATEMEDRLPYAYGPPFPIKPAHELFGEVLLEFNQKKQAKKEFELALDRAPRRARALEGLARANP
jgi:tetratricopeptide (TPR) repeat protein